MKRLLSILLTVMLLMTAGLFLDETAKAEEYATVISANGYGVRLRSGPSTSYGVITKFPVGTTVIVLQRGDAWSQLQVGSTVGWMDNTFLSFGTNSGVVVPDTNGVGNGTVWSANGLRVWLRATAGGKRLSLYSPGTQLTILEKGDKWCRVYISGAVGYMMAEFIKTETTPVASKKVTAVSVNYNYPAVNDTLTAIVTPADATASFVWTVDDEVCSTSSEMLVLSRFAGKKIKLTATGTGAYYGSAVWTTEAVQEDPWIQSVALSNPNPAVGDVLSALVQPSSASVDYSWRVNGTPVSTEATYTVQDSDSGKLIQLKVTGNANILGSASVTADNTVTDGKQLLRVELSSTEPKPNDVLTAAVYPSAANVLLTWTADGVKESTSSSYKVKTEDIGKVIKVTAEGVTPYTGTVTASTGRVEKAYLTGISLSTTAPCAGRTISAYVTPADATVTYQWYLDGAEIAGATASSYTVKAADADKKLSVKAAGVGVYGGSITSAETSKVLAHPEAVAVKLDNVTPILGDKVTAQVVFEPAVTDSSEYTALTTGYTYLWYVDTEKQAGTAEAYNVKTSDVNKHLRVRVIGTANVPADVTSAYSDRVKETKAITGITMYIGDVEKGVKANSRSPEIGETLNFAVVPASATMTYEWFSDSTPVGSGFSYTVAATDKDKRIKVVVKGSGNYTGEVSYTSSTVVEKKKMDETFSFAVPESGIAPVYSTKAVDSDGKVLANATIRWLDAVGGEVAELDEFGNFKPATDYYAELTVSLASGYTLVGASPKLNSITVPASEINGNVITHKYTTAGSLPLTDLYISAMPKPSAGNEAITSFETSQYNAAVTWTKGVTGGIFDMAEEYEADVKITPKSGYEVTTLPNNAFTVENATSAVFAAGTDTIHVKYEINRVLNIVADMPQVELDGINDQLIVCYATLSDYDGSLDSAITKWTLSGEVSNSKTCINENGLLYIAGNEPVGKSLTVNCEATVGGKTYTASKSIALVSGTSSNTVSVVFETVHNSIIAGGASLKFKAHAINSDKGVTYYAESDSVTSPLSHTNINSTTGELTVGVNEQAKSVVVVAQSNEVGQAAVAKWEVVIVHQNIATKTLAALALETDEKTYLFGKNLSAMTFPKAKLAYEDSSTEIVDVNWDYTSVSPAYDPSVETGSDFTIAGTVILPGDVVNPDSISTSVILNVHVSAKEKLYLKSFTSPTWSVEALKNGVTVSEVINALPHSVSCDLNSKEDFSGEDSTGKMDILWDETSITPAYDPASTEKSTFTISGIVDMSAYENPTGIDLAVSLTVTVAAQGMETKVLTVDTTPLSLTSAYSDSITDESLETMLDTKRIVSYQMGANILSAEFPVSWTCTKSYDHSQPGMQIVTFKGTVQLSGIDNPDNIPVDIEASITVDAQPAKLALSASSYAFTDCDFYLKGSYTGTYTATLRNIGGSSAAITVTASGDTSVITLVSSPTALAAGEIGQITLYVDPSAITEPRDFETKLTVSCGTSTVELTATLKVTPKIATTFTASVSPTEVEPGSQSITFTIAINDPYGEFAVKNGQSWVEGEGWFTDGATNSSLTITDDFELGVDKNYTVAVKDDDGLIGTATVTVTVKEPEVISE